VSGPALHSLAFASEQTARDADPCVRTRLLRTEAAHAITRQRADLAHELAHALLLHEPHVVRDGKAPDFDQLQEEEASWLGGVLLVTEEACLSVCRRNLAVGEAASMMGVSEDLMRWRINATGARKRVARARNRRRDSGAQRKRE
jgi:Zn-dependent peptidase ImmA (M78 family)